MKREKEFEGVERAEAATKGFLPYRCPNCQKYALVSSAEVVVCDACTARPTPETMRLVVENALLKRLLLEAVEEIWHHNEDWPKHLTPVNFLMKCEDVLGQGSGELSGVREELLPQPTTELDIDSPAIVG